MTNYILKVEKLKTNESRTASTSQLSINFYQSDKIFQLPLVNNNKCFYKIHANCKLFSCP